MTIVSYSTAAEFGREVIPLLMRREAQNNLIIGKSIALAAKQADEKNLLASIQSDGRIIGAAMMTPPHHLVFTDASDEAVDALAHWIHARRIPPPGISAPVNGARRFAATWHAITGRQAQLRHSLRVFALEKVIRPQPHARGSFHVAASDDASTIQDWAEAFARSLGEPNPEARTLARERLKERNFFLWKDPSPVSMAAVAGPTPNGIRINSVYTPERHRNRGYASACVASLSQHMLDSGRRFCFLYTDLANPTSNHIYQQIGYQRVCDWLDLIFEAGGPHP